MQGFLNLVGNGVETAFTLGSEFVKLGVYTKKSGNGVYDPETDSRSDTTSTVADVRFLQVGTSEEEREAAPVTVNDAKFLIPAKDLGALVPSENDYFTILGQRWNVLIYKPTPGNKLHIIFGRRA